MATARSSNRDLFEETAKVVLPDPPPEFTLEQNIRGNFFQTQS
jgi:hypothetical protein